MRVLHFYKTSFPDTMGGVEQVINQIARGANKLGVETDVLSLTAERVPHTIEMDGYRVHRVALHLQVASTGFSATAFWRFAQLAKNADVIHYHFPWPFMDLVHFATQVKKPTLVTYHSDILRQNHLLKVYRPLMYKFLGDMDRIVATSANYFSTSDVLRKYKHKVNVIPLGLDKATYPQPSPDKLQYWRDRIGPNFFLFVGVLRYYKGLHILIEAAQGTNFPIVIVGAGPIEKELKAKSGRLGLNNIYFLGYLPDDDKVALLMLCDCIVFPSHLRSEAFGITLLEGAMYGKPMISSEIGTGTTFINIDGKTGLVVPPGDADALRQAMSYLWTHREEASVMGRRAEQRYWELFTGDRMVKAYVNLYREMCGDLQGKPVP